MRLNSIWTTRKGGRKGAVWILPKKKKKERAIFLITCLEGREDVVSGFARLKDRGPARWPQPREKKGWVDHKRGAVSYFIVFKKGKTLIRLPLQRTSGGRVPATYLGGEEEEREEVNYRRERKKEAFLFEREALM